MRLPLLASFLVVACAATTPPAAPPTPPAPPATTTMPCGDQACPTTHVCITIAHGGGAPPPVPTAGPVTTVECAAQPRSADDGNLVCGAVKDGQQSCSTAYAP